MLNVAFKITFQFVIVFKATKVIHLWVADRYQQLLQDQRLKIFAILHHVEQTHNVLMEFARAHLSIMAIRMQDADLNASLATIVHVIKLARVTNVSIHVQEHVGKMRNVKLSIIFQPAHVQKEWLETHLHNVQQNFKIQLSKKIPANQLHVDQILDVKL